MKILFKNSLFDAISDFKDFGDHQFVAFVYSSLHLDNLLASMKLDGFTNGLIFLMPLEKERFPDYYFSHPLFSSCVFYKLRTQTSTFKYHNFKRILCLQKGKKIKIYNPMGVNIRTLSMLPISDYKIEYCIIEEGIGTYILPSYEGWKIRFFLLLKRHILHVIKSVILFFFRVNVRENVLFKVNGTFALNEKLIKTLKEVYTEFACLRSNTSLDVINKIERNFILFYKDYGVDDILLYKLLFSHLAKSSRKVYIKMHPLDINENFSVLVRSYGFEMIPSLTSGEQLAGLKPSITIGGISSVIFTSSSIFDNTVYSIFDIYKKMNLLPIEISQFEFLRNNIGVLIPNLKFINDFSEII